MSTSDFPAQQQLYDVLLEHHTQPTPEDASSQTFRLRVRLLLPTSGNQRTQHLTRLESERSLKVDPSTIWYVLRRRRMTFKKVPSAMG